MAWIRLDDQIAHHPKCVRAGLASWLYVCCIGFAQKFLTNGFIPEDQVGSLSGGITRPLNHIRRLVEVGLLDQVPNGYQIHDYLDFNDSAAEVKKKRELDRVRKESERNPSGVRAESERSPESVLARAPASHPIPSVPIQEEKKKSDGNGSINARSKRPIFQGQRFVVFDWMLEDLMRILGPHTEAFDLHTWFFELDALSVNNGLVIPKKDVWFWLQKQLEEECHRRRLPLVNTGAAKPKRGTWKDLAAAHRGHK